MKLGTVFALCNADEQAEFLNVAGRTLRRVCANTDGVTGSVDAQCCYIVDALDGAGRDFIKRLASFIEHDEQTPRVEKRVVYEDEVIPRARDGEEVGP